MMQQCFGGMQRNEEKEVMGNRKKRNILEKLNSLGLQINSSICFLKAAVIKMRAMLFSTLLKVRQNWKNPVKHLGCSFQQQ